MKAPIPVLERLPGADLVRRGMADLAAGEITPPALLVAIGARRLRGVGLAVPERITPDPELDLFALLALEGPDSAHGRYNALLRRLVSFERAAEHAARR